MTPESVIRAHDAHTRLAATDCPGELVKDDGGVWTCLRDRCSFRAIARGAAPAQTPAGFVAGRNDPDDNDNGWGF